MKTFTAKTDWLYSQNIQSSQIGEIPNDGRTLSPKHILNSLQSVKRKLLSLYGGSNALKSRSMILLLRSIDALVTVGYIQEEVFIMMFLVQSSHCCRGWWNDIIYKEEESVFWPQVNSFPDEKVELSNCQI